MGESHHSLSHRPGDVRHHPVPVRAFGFQALPCCQVNDRFEDSWDEHREAITAYF